MSNDYEALRDAGLARVRGNRPTVPPLIFMTSHLVEWIESRHMALFHAAGFTDARRAFNAVFIYLPADGCRLTELATRASMTKQAMGELVDELVRLDYLARFPDPKDGRAKIILRAERGLAAHEATLKIFSQIDAELAEMFGAERLERLRADLVALEQVAGMAASPASASDAETPSDVPEA